VRDHFELPEFANKLKTIDEYAKYALSVQGPAHWEVPLPRKPNKGDKVYAEAS